MADVDLLRRVEMLESTVESLRVLPGEMRQLSGRVDRLESQFVQLRAEMRDGFSAIRGEMATKADLVGFATKADLSGFATKADLAGFATKADLADFATKADLAGFATKADLAGFATKADVAGSASKADLAGFATKADLADGLDSLRKEVREDIAGAVRELTRAIVETRRELVAQTRTLMEDIISRLRVLGEGRS